MTSFIRVAALIDFDTLFWIRVATLIDFGPFFIRVATLIDFDPFFIRVATSIDFNHFLVRVATLDTKHEKALPKGAQAASKPWQNESSWDLLVSSLVFHHLVRRVSSRKGGRGEGKPSPGGFSTPT